MPESNRPLIDQSSSDRANLIGSGWMVAAMAAFAVEDVMIKAAAVSLPAAEIMILFGLGGAAAFAIYAKQSHSKLISAEALSGVMRLRMLFEIVGRLFYTLAITLTPLSSATVILQATPLVVVGALHCFLVRKSGSAAGLRFSSG